MREEREGVYSDLSYPERQGFLERLGRFCGSIRMEWLQVETIANKLEARIERAEPSHCSLAFSFATDKYPMFICDFYMHAMNAKILQKCEIKRLKIDENCLQFCNKMI